MLSLRPLLIVSGALLLVQPFSHAAGVAEWGEQVMQRNPQEVFRSGTLTPTRFEATDVDVRHENPVEKKFRQDDENYDLIPEAWYFNGRSSKVTVPTLRRLGNVSALSGGVWVKPAIEALGSRVPLLSKMDGTSGGFSLSVDPKGSLTLTLVTDKGQRTATAFGRLRHDKWQHVGFVWDGQQIQLFVDGLPVSKPVAAAGVLRDSDRPLTLGFAADGRGRHYQGSLGEIVLHATAIRLAARAGDGQPVYTEVKNELPADGVPTKLRDFNEDWPVPAATVDFEDLSGWKVISYKDVTVGSMERSQEQVVWGKSSAKVSYRNGPALADERSIVMVPPAPVEIRPPFDAIRLWVFARNWNRVGNTRISVQWETLSGEKFDTSLQSEEAPHVFWTGWAMLNKTLPRTFDEPARLLSITISGFNLPKTETIYMDHLSFVDRNLGPLKETPPPTWEELGVRTGVDQIVPPLKGEGVRYSNSVTQVAADEFVLAYEGEDETVRYRYRPGSGTLGDIVAEQGGQTYFPMSGGGWQVTLGETVIGPLDAGVGYRLVRAVREGDAVRADWVWKYGDTEFPFTLTLRISRKSLIVEAGADTNLVSELQTGLVSGLKGAFPQNVPYLTLRGRYHKSTSPQVLCSPGGFTSVILDWYVSRASELFSQRHESAEGIAVNGGSAYYPKTDGQRNTPFERVVLSASANFEEVLPDIPNPPNPWNNFTANMIWSTRIWYVKDPMPEYFDKELAWYRKLHQYGVRNVGVRLHTNIYSLMTNFRGEPRTQTISMEPMIGGGKALAAFSKAMREDLGYGVGIITNYTLASHASFEETHEDLFSLTPQGNWRYGSNTDKGLKPGYMEELQRKWTKALRDAYSFSVGYTDQITCRPAWALVDYDARSAFAGQFAPVLRYFAQALRTEADVLGGPVFSEGIMQWMLAGFTDSYAQPGNYEEPPLLPDFQLYRIHPLSNDIGYALPVVTYEPRLLLSAQLAYGNIAHLADSYRAEPRKKGPSRWALKSYFMMLPLQQQYANTQVKEILYHDKGELISSSEAVRRQSLGNSQIRIRYANGMEVYVNRNGKESWHLPELGVTLAPHGYYASGNDGLLGWSLEIDGSQREYLVTGHSGGYIYCDAGRSSHDFGPIKTSGAWVIHRKPEGLELMPAPYQFDETAVADLGQIGFLHNGTVTLTAQDEQGGEVFRRTVNVGADQKVALAVTQQTFRFIISK